MSNFPQFERVLNFIPSATDQILYENSQLLFDVSDDFIGVFDNAFSLNFCTNVINYYEELEKRGVTYFRSQRTLNEGHKNSLNVEDKSVDFVNGSFYLDHGTNFNSEEFGHIFWKICYPFYVKKFPILQSLEKHTIDNIKIQKTEPTQGYHIWHCEASGASTSRRLLAFNLYLNDVEVGGETEFLYQKRRIASKAGRLVIWPAFFTHTHRGNPPISGTKYILTGWVQF